DVQVEHGEGEDGTEVNLSVDEKVNGEGKYQDVKEPFVERFATSEERHFEVMANFLAPLPLGRACDPADLLAMRIGGPYVVNTRQLLDDCAVHRFSCAQ